jgi:histidinol dehydrogenase
MKIIQENIQEFTDALKQRGNDKNTAADKTVAEIIADVRENGDDAVKKYTDKFDCPGVEPKYYEVPQDAIYEALSNADESFVHALLNCLENITEFHQRQKQNGYTVTKENGVFLGQRVRGLDKAGIYVPGGRAAYPSTVLMNAVPAKIAGVGEIIMVTPPLKDGTPNNDILVAAAICGVDRVFLCGGASAVAALAYGTETVPKVSKIVGPGNIYVACAKKQLYGTVDIDMFAGPSEILVIADSTATPAYVAADLLSQAEHDPQASSVLITDSPELAEKVDKEVERQMTELSRSEIMRTSIDNYGVIIVVKDLDEAVRIANDLAPEHLEVLTQNPFEYIGKLHNAGTLFLGEYSPEPLGDYYAGPNHVLPTNGTARFFSPLSVDSFTKKSGYIYYTKQALSDAADDIILVAEREALTAHANAVRVRLQEGEQR